MSAARIVVATALAAAVAVACGSSKEPKLPQTNKVVIPAVTGRKLQEAKGMLQAKDLEVAVSHQPYPGLPTGTVVSESPHQGELVEAGTEVRLTVVRGR